MISDTLRHTAELALIHAVPMLSDAHEKSRLSGLQNTLQRLAAKELGKIRYITDQEMEKIIAHVTEWGKQTGWLNTQKHVGTLFSFCLEIIEKSNFKFNPKIIVIINEIIKHLENGKDFPFQSCWAGSIAAAKWEGLFKEAA